MFSSLRSRIKNYYYIRFKHMDSSDINIMNLRKQGVVIGEGCRIFTAISSREPSLIKIGDRVTISSEVGFCTHDNAIIKAIPGKTDVVGKIVIGNDCFVGMRSLRMDGVTLGDHCIVAAGSVVTKSFPPNSVIGGNPAKTICTINEYAEKYKDYAIDFRKIPLEDRADFFSDHAELMVNR